MLYMLYVIYVNMLYVICYMLYVNHHVETRATARYSSQHGNVESQPQNVRPLVS